MIGDEADLRETGLKTWKAKPLLEKRKMGNKSIRRKIPFGESQHEELFITLSPELVFD